MIIDIWSTKHYTEKKIKKHESHKKPGMNSVVAGKKTDLPHETDTTNHKINVCTEYLSQQTVNMT
jgi:hypothetical protein